MSTAEQVVAAARADIGYTECPRDAQGHCIFTGHKGAGANHTKFAAEAHLANGTYWCAVGTTAVLRRTETIVPPGVLTASTRANMAAWQAADQWVEPADIIGGDIVFYHLTGRNGKNHNTPDHTGIAERHPVGGRQPAIEYNTSSDDHGSQDNGGGVFPKHRLQAVVIGAGRPDYAATAPLPIPNPILEDAMYLINPTADDAQGGPIYLLLPNQSKEVGALFPLTLAEFEGGYKDHLPMLNLDAAAFFVLEDRLGVVVRPE